MKQKKDIVFLCQFFYPEFVSSATLPYDTAKALRENGFSVGALCGYPKEYTDINTVPLKETVDGISIKRLKYLQLKRSNFLGRLLNYFSFTIAVLLNFTYLRNFRAIIVYSNPPVLPWVAQLAKQIFGCKLIFVAYDLYPEIALKSGAINEGGIICEVMRYINKRVYSTADMVVALSNEMQDFIRENRTIDPNKIVVIPNWYEDNYDVMKGQGQGIFDEYVGKIVLSYLGNMGTCQDVETLIEAAKLMKNDTEVQFLFAGHGNKVEYIKEEIVHNNLRNVRICGFLKGQDYLNALEASSLAVVSVEKQLTGLCSPSKAYAYMMAGIPILVIMGENAELAQDIKNSLSGFVVTNGDAEAIVSAVKFIRENHEEYKGMKSNVRQLFLEKYETRTCTMQYVQNIGNLLNE